MFSKLVVISILTFTVKASAFVTFNSSASFGYYKDDQQASHLPLIYSFSSNYVAANRIEASLDFFLSNDFFINQWSAVPSQAVVTVPLSEGLDDAPYKVSRIQLGRQLFLEGFDISILDGIQIPVYWSKFGGFWFYGGNARVLDLLDTTSSPLAGLSLFQDLLGFKFRGGFGARQNQLTEKYSYGSITKTFEEVWLSPTVFSKQEYDFGTAAWSQSYNQLQLNPTSDFSVSHALRKPRKLASDQNQFVYYVFAQSAQETEQAALQFQLGPEISTQILGRLMRFNTGAQMEVANQQEITLSWAFMRDHTVTPLFGHIKGYGGELWDTGLSVKSRVNDLTSLTNEISAAYLDKINNIVGWAYQWRSGASYSLGARWVSNAWIEIERNHLFLIDARVVANVTYFN